MCVCTCGCGCVFVVVFVVVCLCVCGCVFVVVCVSHPGQRVSPHHFHTGRGAVSLIPSTAQRRRWFETVTFGEDALRTYLPSFPHAVTLLFHFLIHGSSCFHPLNLCFAADLSRQFTAADLQPSQAKQSMFKHLQVVGLFTMRLCRLSSHRDNFI